jgi:hypothetical protein
MLRTLFLVEWEIRSVVSCTAAFRGATHSAVERREEGVEAFRQHRVREDRISHVGANDHLLDRVRRFVEPRLTILAFEHMDLGDGQLVALSVRSLSGQGPEPFPYRVG